MLTTSSRLAPTALWRELAVSDVFKQLKRDHVMPDACSEKPLEPLSRSCFSALGAKATIDESKLDCIMEPATSWNSLSSLGKNDVPAAFALMMDATETGNRDTLPTAWNALLPVRGDVIRRCGNDDGFLVLDTSRFAFLGLKCNLAAQGDGMVSFKACKDQPAWQILDDCDAWECLTLDVSPPCYAAARGHKPELVVIASGATSLLVRCARVGFKHLSAVYLDKVLRQKQVFLTTKERPRTTVAKVVMLLKFVCPKWTDEQINAAVAARYAEVKKSVGIVSSSSEVANDVLDPQDKKLLKTTEDAAVKGQEDLDNKKNILQEGSKFLEILGKKLPPAPAVPPAAPAEVDPAAPPAEGAPGAVKQKVKWSKITDERHAKALLPKIIGCSIQCVLPKKCWTAFYPEASPASRTRTWGTRWTNEQCMKHCIKWAWDEHQAATGIECHFEF